MSVTNVASNQDNHSIQEQRDSYTGRPSLGSSATTDFANSTAPLIHSQSLPDSDTCSLPLATEYNLAASEGGLDRTWYLQTYPDVAMAGIDPVEHYLRNGWKEGRDPRRDFSTSGYLTANKNVEGNPLLHYLRFGGIKVGTDYNLMASEDGVDGAWYLQKYPDVAMAGVDPVEHYLRNGWKEGRDPRGDFSTSGYLRANKNIEGNPLLHYLRNIRHAHSGETAVNDWYLLWKKGFLRPKEGQELSPNAAFGLQGVRKILFAGHEASRTGAPLILLRLMEAIHNRTGAELVLMIEKGGPLLEDYRRIAHVLLNDQGILYLPGGPNLARMLGSIAYPRPELAICNSADSWRIVRALREAGLPHLICLVHERLVRYHPDVCRSIHQNSSHVIFPAHAVKAETTVTFPDFQDASVVPQGLLKPEFGRGDRKAARIEVRNRLGLSFDTKIILGCGTQDMRKAIDLFVQLASRVRAQTKRDVHFVWLGAENQDSYFKTFIELDISLLDLRSAISQLDEVTDPELYFLAADAFVLTSRDDPFPCVIHEAMACALPIIAFDGSGGAKEAISDGCGIVVPYLDVEAMATSLISVLKHPLRYAAIGHRAQLRVRSVYRFSEYVERIAEACDAVMGKLAPNKPPDTNHSTCPAAAAPLRAKCSPTSEPTYDEAASHRLPRIPEVIEWFQALRENVGGAIRAEQWWDYKLLPILSVFYATAYVQHVSIASVWPAAIALLLAMVSCAAYVSLVNDVTDRADDRRAGKANRMAGRPLWQRTAFLAAPLCAAVFFSVLWRDDLALVAAYLGSWAAFSLYSLPPFRLKSRGAPGLLADACGSHVFPTLTAALLVQRASGHPIDPVWITALVVWAFGCGLRGILWHQLYDFEADQKAGVRTFVLRHSRRAAIRLARTALLIELTGLGVVLWDSRTLWPELFLLIYAVFATLKSRMWNCSIVIAEPRGRYSILGQEYYTLLFPVALLLSSALQNPADWTVLIVHLFVFPQPAVSFIRETCLLAQCSLANGWFPRGGKPNSDRRDERAMTLDAAVAKAAAFLRERLRSGSYGLAAVGSDGLPRFPDDKGHLFVASFIAEAMTGLFDEIDRTIILTRILAEEQNGAWGYQSPGMLYTDETRPFLVDSDDSAFVIRTLHRLGVNREPRGLMRFHREPDRLFVTWDTGMDNPVSLTTQPSLRNNFLAHPEVNANIFLALRGTHFEKYVNYEMLLKAQDERGFWKSYFYPSPLYATLLVLDLTRGKPAFASASECALSFIAGSQNADGSWGDNSDPYATALAVAGLAGHQAHAAARHRGIEHLLSTMAGDGSWKSGACVWESYWTEHDVWRGYDTHRAYVSARCLIALRRAAGQLAPP